MNRSDLINALCDKVNLSHKEMKLVTEIIFEKMQDSLIKNNRIEIRGFGTFYRKERKSFLGINPKTGERIAIPKKFSIAFRPSKDFKNSLNK
jgi:integration host factor subunit beta